MTTRLLPLLAALALSPVLAPPAFAGDVEKAEHTRISEEMRKLAARNAWPAVEASFKRLEELEKKGEVITYKEFMLGAEAARALGDMTSARSRVERAAKIDPTKEALDWLSDVDQNYGRVEISFDNRYQGAKTLAPSVPPFAPDQRASITFAQAQLEAGKGYTGLLPAGEYTIGETKLVVSTGEKVAALRVGPPAAPAKEPFKLAYVGPRAQIGVAYTLAGDVDNAALSGGGLQAGAFGGAGARLGVGLEVGLSKNFGVIAEVGYHNLFGEATYGGAPVAAREEYLVSGNNFHLGYGWLAANLRFGNVWFAAGPIWSAGGGVVTGVDDGCVEGACGDFSGLTDETAAYQRLDGDVRMGGGAAALSFAIVDFGSLKGAVTVEGGAQSDTLRLYPWGQVAFTIAPSASRRKE